MIFDNVSQAAVDAAIAAEAAASRACLSDDESVAYMLAAAAPHLVDDAMVDRGARALFAYQVKGDLTYPEGYDETYWTARVRPVLHAALGDNDA